MIGFRSKTHWKMIFAVTYYALCFLGFSKNVYFGIAVLIFGWTVPILVNSIFCGIRNRKVTELYTVCSWMVAVCISFVMGYTGNKNHKTTASTTDSSVVEADFQNKSSYNDKVYVTGSGSKYHKSDCQFISGKQTISMSVSEAADDGKEPCDICFGE